MIVSSNVGGPGRVPGTAPGSAMIASFDVEWTKDYRVRNGNRPFCYSVVWLPVSREGLLSEQSAWGFTSAYVERDDEIAILVDYASRDLGASLDSAAVVAGHQLCSDLSVLRAFAPDPALPHLVAARNAWHGRRAATAPTHLIDTRFDATPLLAGRSRRLVDVCSELGLDVEQPELRQSSMTALHRRWLTAGQAEARERITVLNLRHSVSTALVAALVGGLSDLPRPFNVNRLLGAGLGSTFGWLSDPRFLALHARDGAPNAA